MSNRSILRIFTALIISQMLHTVVLSQHQSLRFKNFTPEDGLVQSSVNCIYQDSRGFMWLGTQDGLSRFDGYEFRNFKHSRNDSTTLSNNWIWAIEEDSSGSIWLGTFGGGLNRYDRQSDEFEVFLKDPENQKYSIPHNGVRDIIALGQTIVVGTDLGIALLDLDTHSIQNLTSVASVDDMIHVTNIVNMCKSSPSSVLVSVANQLMEIDVSDTSSTVVKTGIAEHLGREPHLASVVLAPGNGLWISTTSGVGLLDRDSDELTWFEHDPSKQLSLPSNNILAMTLDSDNILWVGTPNGMARIWNAESGWTLTVDRFDETQPTSLASNYILSVFASVDGEVWVGGRAGLSLYERQNHQFDYIAAKQHHRYGLSDKKVLPIIEDYQKHIWIGTNKGLNRMDPVTKEIEQIYHQPDEPNSLSSSYVMSLLEDREQRLWIGTRGGGLNWYDYKTGTYTRLPFDRSNPDILEFPNVNFIMEDNEGSVWVAAKSLHKHLGNGRFQRWQGYLDEEHGPPRTYVFAMMEDSSGRFWVASAGYGLYVLDRLTEHFYRHQFDAENMASLSHNMVLCLFESPTTGDIWIGTAGGLNRLANPEHRVNGSAQHAEYEFQSFDESDGLPNSVIYGVLEDDDGYLWVSTNGGIARLSPDNDQLQVKAYTKHDGLQENEFNQNAFLKDSEGRLYFGGIGGLNIFNPRTLYENERLPRVQLTGFRIINQPVSPNLHPGKPSQQPPIVVDIVEAEKVHLDYQDYVISFEFAALNYTSSEENEYAYMLEGFDPDWIFSGTRRFATYTNLDPGEYTFRVKASNNDGYWNESGREIMVFISPPPWRSWWAYLLYTLLIATGIVLVSRAQRHRQEREIRTRERIAVARADERELVRKKSSADFHDEAGNLLTKVSLFIAVARRELGKGNEIYDYLDRIEENTKLLASRMRDFIWVLDPEKDSLFDILIRLKDFGNSLFQQTAARYSFIGISEKFTHVNLTLDQRRAILMIFKEALNNCFKYAGADNIELVATINNNILSIQLRDDGSGFDANQITMGYGLKNMRARAEKIESHFSISSNVGEGTSICVEIVLTHMGELTAP